MDAAFMGGAEELKQYDAIQKAKAAEREAVEKEIPITPPTQ
jgi:hypothetical protein